LVRFISPGSCVIAANQNGDSNYTSAPRVLQTVAVGKGAQAITFTSTPPAGAVVGGSYQVTATGGPTLNPVMYSIDPSSTAGACTVAGLGLVHLTGSGICVIDADQAGNANYAAAPRVSQSMAVGKAAQAITFTSTPPVGAVVGGSYQVTTTGAGSGNPVTFRIHPSSGLGVCTVTAAGLVQFSRVGPCVVDADQLGDSDYAAAREVSQTLAVSADVAVPIAVAVAMPAVTPAVGPTSAAEPANSIGALAFTGSRVFAMLLTAAVASVLGVMLLLIAGHRRDRPNS
jgi:hypothetical protein